MDGSSFLTPAVNCVKELQACSVPEEELFRNPRNTSLASAISMLSHTAQFIERAVRCDEKLHDIGIFVACRIKKHPEPEVEKDPTFLLWNSIRNSRDLRTNNLEGDNALQRPSNNQARHVDRVSNPDQSGLRSNDSHAPERNACLERSQQPVQNNTIKRLQSQLQPSSAEKNSYSVPVTIAAKCLELLLDGSGFSSHRNIFQKRSYTELGTKPLIDAVKEVFRAEQKVRVSDKDGSARAVNTTGKDDMIYCDLLPDHLRKPSETDKRVSVSVPEVVLGEMGHVTVPQYMKVSMDIRKPDRNKKHQNFAVLCVLLDHTGPTGICAKTLREYARLGFTAEGCKRRKKYSTSSKSTCNSTNSSCHSNRALCTFLIPSDTKPLGKGSVDPFATMHDGEKITNGSVLVRFANVRALEDITFPSDVTSEQKSSMHTFWANGIHTTWPKSGIKRIELLGDFGKPIGSAIIVHYLIPMNAHQSILKRIKRSCNNRSSLEVTNAIVVCDVHLKPHDESNPPVYPYMEWYNLSCFKMLQDLHFKGQDPPKVMTSEFIRSARALLWNKNQYKELD